MAASRPGAADAQDAGQRVWLHLVEHLGNLRDSGSKVTADRKALSVARPTCSGQ
jgi:hypothetical protein